MRHTNLGWRTLVAPSQARRFAAKRTVSPSALLSFQLSVVYCEGTMKIDGYEFTNYNLKSQSVNQYFWGYQ